MSSEITLHTGDMGDWFLIHVDWFDENNVRKKTDVEIRIREQDKPRVLEVTVKGKAELVYKE